VVFEKSGLCVGKSGGDAKQRPLKKIIHCFASWPCAFFSITIAQLLAWFVFPRPEQLVRSTPYLPCGLPKEARDVQQAY